MIQLGPTRFVGYLQLISKARSWNIVKSTLTGWQYSKRWWFSRFIYNTFLHSFLVQKVHQISFEIVYGVWHIWFVDWFNDNEQLYLLILSLHVVVKQQTANLGFFSAWRSRMQEICNVKISLLQPAVTTGHIIFLIQTIIVKKGWKTPNKQYYYLSVSTRAVIGQFGGPDSPVRPAKIWSCFCCQTVSWFYR